MDISAVGANASRLLNKGKDYDILLQHLIELNFYHDEDSSLPIVKSIAHELGEDYNRTRKYIKRIYQDLFYPDDYEGVLIFAYNKAKRIMAVGEVMQVKLLDHLTVIGESYFRMMDEGMM